MQAKRKFIFESGKCHAARKYLKPNHKSIIYTKYLNDRAP